MHGYIFFFLMSSFSTCRSLPRWPVPRAPPLTIRLIRLQTWLTTALALVTAACGALLAGVVLLWGAAIGICVVCAVSSFWLLLGAALGTASCVAALCCTAWLFVLTCAASGVSSMLGALSR